LKADGYELSVDGEVLIQDGSSYQPSTLN